MNPGDFSKYTWDMDTHTRHGEKSQQVYLSLSYEQRAHMELDQNEEVHLKPHRALSVPCVRMDVK